MFSNMFDRELYKANAKAQIGNVVMVFMLFIFIEFILAACSGSMNVYKVVPSLISGNHLTEYEMQRMLSGGVTSWSFFGVLAMITRLVTPYFEVKSCLISYREHRKVEISEIFQSFSWNEFFNVFFKGLCAALLVVAALIGGALGFMALISCGTVGINMSYVIYLLFAVLSVVLIYSFMLVPYLAFDRPELSIWETIMLSKDYMKGEKWNMFVMSLSFIGWFLLVLITAGIAGIYVQPYYNLAVTEAYKYICRENGVFDEPVQTEETAAPAEAPAEPLQTPEEPQNTGDDPAPKE